MGIVFILSIFRQPTKQAGNRIIACLIFALITISFWTLYMLTPTLFKFFTQQLVSYHLFDSLLPMTWFNNTSLLIVTVGGFLISLLFHRLRKKGYAITLPKQFAIALLLLFLAFTILPFAIEITAPHTQISLIWLILSYTLQAFALLFIQPIGYAMIGQLTPIPLQGLMMGTWLMLSGMGASLASLLSKAVFIKTSPAQLLTDKHFYISRFYIMAGTTFVILIILLLLSSLLNKLIHYRSLDPTHH